MESSLPKKRRHSCDQLAAEPAPCYPSSKSNPAEVSLPAAGSRRTRSMGMEPTMQDDVENRCPAVAIKKPRLDSGEEDSNDGQENRDHAGEHDRPQQMGIRENASPAGDEERLLQTTNPRDRTYGVNENPTTLEKVGARNFPEDVVDEAGSLAIQDVMDHVNTDTGSQEKVDAADSAGGASDIAASQESTEVSDSAAGVGDDNRPEEKLGSHSLVASDGLPSDGAEANSLKLPPALDAADGESERPLEEDDNLLAVARSGKSSRSPTSRGARKSGERRKSKRRSSFVRGRISRPLDLAQSAGDLLEGIPSDLPEDERLARLNEAALKYAVQKLAEEFPDLEGMQQFVVEASEAATVISQKLRSAGEYQRLTNRERFLPNPANAVIEDCIKRSETYGQRLDAEEQTWEEMVQLRSRLAEQAERDFTSVGQHPITELVGKLTPEQKVLIDGRPNYQAALDELRTQREEAELAVDEISRACGVLKESRRTAGVMLSEHASQLYAQSFEGIQEVQDPKQLLEAILNHCV